MVKGADGSWSKCISIVPSLMSVLRLPAEQRAMSRMYSYSPSFTSGMLIWSLKRSTSPLVCISITPLLTSVMSSAECSVSCSLPVSAMALIAQQSRVFFSLKPLSVSPKVFLMLTLSLSSRPMTMCLSLTTVTWGLSANSCFPFASCLADAEAGNRTASMRSMPTSPVRLLSMML